MLWPRLCSKPCSKVCFRLCSKLCSKPCPELCCKGHVPSYAGFSTPATQWPPRGGGGGGGHGKEGPTDHHGDRIRPKIVGTLLEPQSRFCVFRSSHMLGLPPLPQGVPRIIVGTGFDIELWVLFEPPCRFCVHRSSSVLFSQPLPNNIKPRGARQGGSHGSS